MDYPELRNTTFGKVFVELLETRGLEVTPFRVGELVENTGLDGWAFIDRMASADSRRLMCLDLRLAEELNLSEPEKMELALAFTYELRGSRDLRTEHLSRTNRALGSAIDLLDHVPPDAFGDRDGYFRAKQAIAEAGVLVATAETHHEAREDRPAE